MTLSEMKDRLTKSFPGAHVEVTDLTGTEDHYEVVVKSASFTGQPRIRQHQAVMAAFADELKTGEVHALSIRTMTE